MNYPSCSIDISIPNGSIKSARSVYDLAEHYPISIPNGSIKRKLKEVKEDSKKLFQFLMVQLKEKKKRDDEAIKEISIPNGSIKRGNR